MEKYIIEENENVFGKYDYTENQNGISNNNQITITDKRLYIHKENATTETTNIINIDSIEFVKLENTKIKKNANGAIYIGLATIILCTILTVILKISLLGIGIGIGVIILIIGSCISIPKHIFQMIIGSTTPITINCTNLKDEDITEIQKNIFLAQKYKK